MIARACLLVATLACGPGCAALTKTEALQPSYHAPAQVAQADPPPAVAAAAGERLRLRVAPGAEHLALRHVFRTSSVSYGFEEGRRWTEPPSDYLRRALEQALFESGLRVGTTAADAPTLEVELFAFEELRGPRAAARVALVAALVDADQAVRLVQRTIDVTVPVEDDGVEAVVLALSAALREAVARTAELVVTAGAAPAPATK